MPKEVKIIKDYQDDRRNLRKGTRGILSDDLADQLIQEGYAKVIIRGTSQKILDKIKKSQQSKPDQEKEKVPDRTTKEVIPDRKTK